MTNEERCEWLNDNDVEAKTDQGKIIGLFRYVDRKYQELSDEEYEQLGLDKNNLGSVEEHPEGADRGGYRPELSVGCAYCEYDGWTDE